MPRVLAIDYGKKRTGLAHTDSEKIIASPLETILTKDIFTYLENYLINEEVESIVIGNPRTLQDGPAKISTLISQFIVKIKKKFDLPVYLIDERFTSKIAVRSMEEANIKKNKRKDKSMIDKISATLILQSFLNRENTK